MLIGEIRLHNGDNALQQYPFSDVFYTYQLTTKGRASAAQTSFRPNKLAKIPTGRAPTSAPIVKREPTHEPSSSVIVNEALLGMVSLMPTVVLTVVLMAAVTGTTINSRAGPVQANALPAQNALIVAET